MFAYVVEKLTKMQTKDLEKHIALITEHIATPEKGPPSQKRIYLLHYVAAIAASSTVSNQLIKHGVLLSLAKEIKDAQQIEL